MADELTNQSQNQVPADVPENAPAAAGGEVEVHAGAHGGRSAGARGRRGDRERSDQQRGTRGGRGRRDHGDQQEGDRLPEVVVKVYRCATVVKGGRRFSFAALVAVGDGKSKVGIGYGKANEVPNAVDKAGKAARRSMIDIKLSDTTIPHRVVGKYGASEVLLLPASKGTGIIAGAAVRAVMELAGIKDILTKVHGSTNPKNLVKAAFRGLLSLRKKEDVARLREVSLV